MKNLEYVATLEEFEGDLLNHFKDNETHYVEKWCDVASKETLPWECVYLIAQTTPELIESYLRREISMLTLISSQAKCWIIHRKGNEIIEERMVLFSEVPQSYLPTADSFHDEDLRPEF